MNDPQLEHDLEMAKVKQWEYKMKLIGDIQDAAAKLGKCLLHEDEIEGERVHKGRVF